MSIFQIEPPSAHAPLSIPDTEVAHLILGRDLNRATRDRLRARGEWPPVTYVAGFAVVLTADLQTFLAQAKNATDAARAARQERGRRAVARRWERVHSASAEAA